MLSRGYAGTVLNRFPKAGFFCLSATVLFLSISACGGGGDTGNASDSSAATQTTEPAEAASDLTDWQLENGIGPITEPVELGEIDPALVAQR